MTDRLITVPAASMSGADFLRALKGKPALTEGEKAEREQQKRIRMAELEAQHEREMMEMRKRILAMFKTEAGRAACLARWKAEGVDCTALTEVRSDPFARAA